MTEKAYYSQEQYEKQLEEVKNREEERAKRQKEVCEIEYRKFNKTYQKSSNNYETCLRDKRERDKRITMDLESVEKKINEGYSRSLQRKANIRMSATEALNKIEDVRLTQRKLQEEVENERLMKYLERRKKYLQQLSKWEKQKDKSIHALRDKHESKYG